MNRTLIYALALGAFVAATFLWWSWQPERQIQGQGRGTAIGEALFSRTDELKSDFVFAWYKENWKPWSWKLVSVAQPEIFFDSQWF